MANARIHGFSFLKHTVSLKSTKAFSRLYSKGTRRSGQLVTVTVAENRRKQSRLGIPCSVKLGKAHYRNRVRRRIKEAYRCEEERLRSGLDIMITPKQAAHDCDFAVLRRELVWAFGKLGCVLPRQSAGTAENRGAGAATGTDKQ
jgi:ribonuclease P protein component